ncbi:MAG: hypothetical protein JWR74_1336 [Polaromonas sp.]|nr:hypothetical protein [Polaromonas sp.]
MSVESLISNAQGYAQSVTSDASSALNDATNLVLSVGYSVPNFYPVDLPSTPATTAGLTAPVLTDVALDLPSEPGAAPAFQDISAIEAGPLPVLTAALPTLTLPTAPAQLSEFLAAAPGIETSFAFPSPPDVLMNPLIEAPVLPDRAAPTAPQVMLPVFDVGSPVDTTVAPTDLEGKFRAGYSDAALSTISMLDGFLDAQLTKMNPRFHEQMGLIETQLARYLAGGTGFKPEVEDAIYSRAREKNDREAARVRDAGYGEAASRGFTLPTGALMAGMARARQEAANNNLKAASDIVAMQAEMEQKNLQFAVTTSASLRTAMLQASLSYHQNLISINGQALDCAKSILSAIIETYNTGVKAFSLKLDAYKAEAVVYETRLKSAMAGIELYQAELKALEILTTVDRAKVEVYRARIESLRAYADVYKSQIDAVLGRASLEKLKLDLFQAQVQAYSARVQGKNAEWQGYTAAIGGQNAKAQLYRTQVDGFGAQVQAYKAGIEAKSEVVRAAAATNRARADQYAATLSGYAAVVQARGEKARTQLENQRQEVIAFQVQSQVAIANAQVQNEYYKSVSMVGIENAKMQMTAMIQGADSQRAFGQAVAQLGTSAAQVYSGLASAAMSGMNSFAGEIKNE